MIIQGNIYIWRNYKHIGQRDPYWEHPKRYIVVLNTPSECPVSDCVYYIIATTRDTGGKKRIPGCHNEHTFPNYYLPSEISVFPENTWLYLSIYHIDTSIFEQKMKAGQIIKHGNIDGSLWSAIKNCMSKDLSERMKLLLGW